MDELPYESVTCHGPAVSESGSVMRRAALRRSPGNGCIRFCGPGVMIGVVSRGGPVPDPTPWPRSSVIQPLNSECHALPRINRSHEHLSVGYGTRRTRVTPREPTAVETRTAYEDRPVRSLDEKGQDSNGRNQVR
jgi:hypothetical protein